MKKKGRVVAERTRIVERGNVTSPEKRKKKHLNKILFITQTFGVGGCEDVARGVMLRVIPVTNSCVRTGDCWVSALVPENKVSSLEREK